MLTWRCLPTLALLCSLAIRSIADEGAAQPDPQSGAPAASSTSPPQSASPQALTLREALKQARVGGKYRMLLRQIKMPGDEAEHTKFKDLGLQQKNELAGFKDLPPGYWVYVAPYWYIWRDLAQNPISMDSYVPEQATGPPNTPRPGDQSSAWASASTDNQDEWLRLEYAEPIVPKTVKVFENCSPGALTKVTGWKLDGQEVELWKGQDPTPVGQPHGISILPVQVDFEILQLKLYLDSKRVPGWNEIDAVGIEDTTGNTHWATAAAASSTFGRRQGTVSHPFVVTSSLQLPPPAGLQLQAKIKTLEAEVKRLREEVNKLKSIQKEVGELKALIEQLDKRGDSIKDAKATTTNGK